MDMRNVIRDDEDWNANPRDPVPPPITDAEKMQQVTTIGYKSGGTWDYSLLEQEVLSPDLENKPQTAAEILRFQSKLNKCRIFRDCQHVYQPVQCRCLTKLGLFCNQCGEAFCSEKCGQEPVNREVRWAGTGSQVANNCLIPGRGGHRQGLRRGQLQMQRWRI